MGVFPQTASACFLVASPGASKVNVRDVTSGSYINFRLPSARPLSIQMWRWKASREVFFFSILLMCAALAANSRWRFALKRDAMLMCHSRSAADPSHRRSNKCCSLKVMPTTNQAAATATEAGWVFFFFFAVLKKKKGNTKMPAVIRFFILSCLHLM